MTEDKSQSSENELNENASTPDDSDAKTADTNGESEGASAAESAETKGDNEVTTTQNTAELNETDEQAQDEEATETSVAPVSVDGVEDSDDEINDEIDVVAEVDGFLSELEASDLDDLGLMDEEIPPQFEAFVANLPVNVEGEIEGLEPPADESSIADAEKALGYTFPEDFQNFLTIWNGGTVHNICIYGVGTDDEYDIVNYNETAGANGLSKEFVAFASTLLGDMFCFKKDGEDGKKSAVYLYDTEQSEASIVFDSFTEWLDEIHVIEAELEQNAQPQPMTVQEWESFVKREREKLRRLSKTPARELSMPDPEAIRAELKNKIPVDPRHLKPK